MSQRPGFTQRAGESYRSCSLSRVSPPILVIDCCAALRLPESRNTCESKKRVFVLWSTALSLTFLLLWILSEVHVETTLFIDLFISCRSFRSLSRKLCPKSVRGRASGLYNLLCALFWHTVLRNMAKTHARAHTQNFRPVWGGMSHVGLTEQGANQSRYGLERTQTIPVRSWFHIGRRVTAGWGWTEGNCRYVCLCVSVCLCVCLCLCVLSYTWTWHSWHCCTPAHLFPLLSGLSCTPDHSSNAFALAQVVPQNRVAFDMVTERRLATPRLETLESLQGQAQDRGRIGATSGNAGATPRPGTAVAAATAEQRADTVTPADFATFQQQLRQEVADVVQQLRAEVNEATSGRMDMLNSTPERISKTSGVQTISDQRRHSEKLGRQQRKGIVQELYVGPAPVDASVVRSRRADACQGREHRQV